MLRDVLKKDVVLEMIKDLMLFIQSKVLQSELQKSERPLDVNKEKDNIPTFFSLPSSGHLAISSSEFVAVFVGLIKYRINSLIEASMLRRPSAFPFTVP